MKIGAFQFRCTAIPMCIDLDFRSICVPTWICFKLSTFSIHRPMSLYGWVRNDRDFRNPGDIRSNWDSWMNTSKARRVCTGVNLVGWPPSTAFAKVGTSMIMVSRSSCIVWWVWGKVIHISCCKFQVSGIQLGFDICCRSIR